ncbi:MAG: SUMF1/EgtB/PvdO family nonheme iron enzyme [Victivallales bacterium]|nr:SUMF1/EgtB/PvdO family nonheme iron enzyme [Victivallales bacterium]
MSNSQLLSPGDEFEKYVVEQELGHGGMGAVYLVRHRFLDTEFALKVLYPEVAERDKQYVERFIREGRLACQIRHPNLIAVYDAGQNEKNKMFYLVMDFVSGGNVRDKLKKEHFINMLEAISIVRQVASALEAAQKHNMVHRDIKPDNIMFDDKGVVRLADLGIAKATDDNNTGLTMAASVFGTPAYMSPEQARDSSKVDTRADIYSIGVVFFEMLTGRRPFSGNTTIEILSHVVDSEPAPDVRTFLKDVPEDVAKLVADMLEKDREKRISSPTELIHRLDALNLSAYQPNQIQPEAIPVTESEAPTGVTLPTMAGGQVPTPSQVQPTPQPASNPQSVGAVSGSPTPAAPSTDTISAPSPSTGKGAAPEKKRGPLMYVALAFSVLLFVGMCALLFLKLKSQESQPQGTTTITEPSQSGKTPQKTVAVKPAENPTVPSSEKPSENPSEKPKTVALQNAENQTTEVAPSKPGEKPQETTQEVKTEELTPVADDQGKPQEAAAKLAEEAKAKEAAAKADAEAKAKEAAMQQEVQVWSEELKKALDELESAKIDRGQTFGKHLDNLERNIMSAQNVLETDNAQRFVLAHDWLRTAREERKWIHENAPLRERIQKSLQNIQEAEQKARAEGAVLQKVSEYASASDAVEKLKFLFEQGDFEGAEKQGTVALNKFTEAFELARQQNLKTSIHEARLAFHRKNWDKTIATAEKILKKDPENEIAKQLKSQAEEGRKQQLLDGILAEARNAKKAQNWALVQAKAQEARKLQADHPEATALETEAIKMQQTCLVATFAVNGKTVDAQYTITPNVPGTLENGFFLEKGKTYHVEANYKEKEDEWTAIQDITANWEGKKQVAIELQLKIGKVFTVPLEGSPLNLLLVKAGRFQMGAQQGERGSTPFETLHWVTLSKNYWLGATEVTQGQWKAVMGNNPSKNTEGDNFPVEKVSWQDAMVFCKKLNERFREHLPAGYEFSLPTEAQWEYACRAGTTTTLNSGKDITTELGSCNNLDEIGWYNKNSDGETHPVGQKQPNAWGFFDMHGNVQEWCRDGFYVYKEATDPVGPSAANRIYRGGSYDSRVRDCRTAVRFSVSPDKRYVSLGFRLAIVPKQP